VLFRSLLTDDDTLGVEIARPECPVQGVMIRDRKPIEADLARTGDELARLVVASAREARVHVEVGPDRGRLGHEVVGMKDPEKLPSTGLRSANLQMNSTSRVWLALLVVGCRPPIAHRQSCVISAARSSLAWQYAPAAAGIRGRVVALASGRPLPGALITVAGSQKATSDSAGRFQIALGRGTYVVQVRATGYLSVQDTISLPGLDGFDMVAVLAQPNPGLLGCTSP